MLLNTIYHISVLLSRFTFTLARLLKYGNQFCSARAPYGNTLILYRVRRGVRPIIYLVLLFWGLFRSAYFSVVTHVFTASSTALDRSPFLPPNISMALNLSFFSSSSESTALILPTLITNNFFCVPSARFFSNKQNVLCLRCLLLLSSSLFHLAYLHYILCAYPLISILV